MSATKSPPVGRSQELGLLDEALAAAGEGCLVLVRGEAGIGKTRLCAEARARHSAGSGHTVFGRAYPEDRGLLLSPVSDAVRAARRSRAPLWEAARRRAPVLAAIVPELLAATTEGRGPQERVVVFETVLDAVEEAGGDAALWVIEDLQWADESTWELVAYARRRVADMRLVLAVTYRQEAIGPAHAFSTRLTKLEHEPGVLTLALQRLCQREAERLLGAVAPLLPADAAASVVSRSAGTPLFLEELAPGRPRRRTARGARGDARRTAGAHRAPGPTRSGSPRYRRSCRARRGYRSAQRPAPGRMHRGARRQRTARRG